MGAEKGRSQERERDAAQGTARLSRAACTDLKERLKAFSGALARENFSGENSRADNVFKGICSRRESILLIAKVVHNEYIGLLYIGEQ